MFVWFIIFVTVNVLRCQYLLILLGNCLSVCLMTVLNVILKYFYFVNNYQGLIFNLLAFWIEMFSQYVSYTYKNLALVLINTFINIYICSFSLISYQTRNDIALYVLQYDFITDRQRYSKSCYFVSYHILINQNIPFHMYKYSNQIRKQKLA